MITQLEIEYLNVKGTIPLEYSYTFLSQHFCVVKSVVCKFQPMYFKVLSLTAIYSNVFSLLCPSLVV